MLWPDSSTIRPYFPAAAACHPYDPRSPEVAAKIRDLVRAEAPDMEIEHIGSTSIPGCAGKGIIDLMLLYPEGRLAAARDVLDRLGFQHQTGRDPFPETRPMRVGAIAYAGQLFRLHVHVIAAASADAAQHRAFRDRLRADPKLLAAYVDRKQALIAAGITDTLDYCNAKSAFIQEILG